MEPQTVQKDLWLVIWNEQLVMLVYRMENNMVQNHQSDLFDTWPQRDTSPTR